LSAWLPGVPGQVSDVRAIRGQVRHVRIFAIFRNFDGCVRPGFKGSMNSFLRKAGNSTYGRDIRFVQPNP